MLRNKFYDSLKRILFAFVAMMFVAPAFSATLPAGYTELEYIESTGTQYIDTGVVPTVTKETEVRLTFARTSETAQEGFGGNTNLNIVNSTSNWRLNGVQTAVPIVNNEFVDVVLKQTSDGRYYKIKTTEGYGSVNALETNFYLGKLSNAGNSYSFKGKYKSCAILENGVLVRDFVPAKTTINNETVVGMYDTVNGVFYQNAGSGAFTAGPEIQTYTMLEYIESTGTQYIDTGYVVDDLTSNFQINMVLSDLNGEGTGGNSAGLGYTGINSVATIAYTDRYGLGTQNNGVKVSAGEKYNLLWIRGSDASRILSVNGAEVSNYTQTTLYADRPFGIFKLSPYDGGFFKMYGKVYSFKAYKNGTLVRDMKPARRDSDGRVGMLDTVNNVFYDNAASTTVNFEAGPDLPEVTIKIATTKYNEDAFANLVTTLNSAITKVTNIVDTTVAQATSIGTLATTKQDRPADGDCPAERKCLLVTGTDGKPHWYLIQE